MNKKGFTLIELIATISLLGIVAIISFVSITTIINKSKVSNCESIVMNIKSVTKEYVSDNRYGIIDVNLTAQDLINSKYLSSPIIDPFTNEEMNANNILINIELNDDYTTKNITIDDMNGVLQKCVVE